MKDLPTTLTDGLTIVAIPHLKPWYDVVLFNKIRHPDVTSIDQLPEGSILGTSSLRRICSIKKAYGSKFKIENIWGNLNTRLTKL